MGDEASGGSERLPSNLAGEFQGEASDSDDSHTPSQSVADRPSVQVPPVQVQLASMADRDRRSRGERGPSNVPALRNSQQQQRRHDDVGVPEVRNRHPGRDRNPPSAGRHARVAPSSSANQRPPAAAAAAAEPELRDDDTDEVRLVGFVASGDVQVMQFEDLPRLQNNFVQPEQLAASSSALNWQVCFLVFNILHNFSRQSS